MQITLSPPLHPSFPPLSPTGSSAALEAILATIKLLHPPFLSMSARQSMAEKQDKTAAQLGGRKVGLSEMCEHNLPIFDCKVCQPPLIGANDTLTLQQVRV